MQYGSALLSPCGYAKVESCGALLRGHVCAGICVCQARLRGARRMAVFGLRLRVGLKVVFGLA